VFLRRPPLAHPLFPPAHFVFTKAFGHRRIVYQIFYPAKRKGIREKSLLQIKEAQISAATVFDQNS